MVLIATAAGLAIGGPLFLVAWARGHLTIWRDSRR